VFILFQFHVVIKILFILIIILDYKNFMKLNKFKIFESTYKDLPNKYLSKSNIIFTFAYNTFFIKKVLL